MLFCFLMACCYKITGVKPPATWLAKIFSSGHYGSLCHRFSCAELLSSFSAQENSWAQLWTRKNSRISFLLGINMLAFMRLEDFAWKILLRCLYTALFFPAGDLFFFRGLCRSLSMPSAASTFCWRLRAKPDWPRCTSPVASWMATSLCKN